MSRDTDWPDAAAPSLRPTERNLSALAGVDPDRALRLRGFEGDRRFRIYESEGVLRSERLHRRQWASLGETDDDLLGDVDTCPGAPSSRAQLLVGIGDGRRAQRLLGEIEPDESLVVWEDEDAALFAAFAQTDLVEGLASGRLRVVTTSDLERSPDLRFRRALRALRLRPFTGAQWERARRWLRRHAEGPAPLPPADCWIRRGELLQCELRDGLFAFGRTVREVETEIFADEDYARAPAGGLWMMNLDHDVVAAATARGCSCVVWEIDPSADAVDPLAPNDPRRSGVHIFTWRERRVAQLRAAGYQHVHHLPIGVDPSFRRPRPTVTEGPDEVVFVGSGMHERARDFDGAFLSATADDEARTDLWRELWEERARIEHDIIRDPCRRDVETRLEDARSSRGLPERVSTSYGTAEVRALLGERLAATKRRVLLESLAELPLAVYGEDSWNGLLPEGIWRGPVGHGEPLNRLYTNSAINLDQNRIYQADIATLRVFEASACAGFVLAEWAEDLEPLFDFETEVAVYRDVEELKTLTRHFLNEPTDRRRRAFAARDRVLTDHTVKLRVATMLLTIAESKSKS